MKNRAMLIGAISAGKSTLTNALLGVDVNAFKTQTLIYYDWIVDTPGEYTENPMFYKNIMATSLEVTHVLYLQDATCRKVIFPPGFSMGMNKIPIGVITKSDHPEADIAGSIELIRSIIAQGPIVITSSVDGIGIDHLKKLVQFNNMDSIKRYVVDSADDTLLFTNILYS
jgi:ethanolamine utilization protein EutP